MKGFLFLVGAAVAVAVTALLLYRRAPKGWTRVFLAVAAVSALAFPLGAVGHNAVEALFHVEEPVFFLTAVIGAPLGIIVGFVGAAIAAFVGKNGAMRRTT